MLDCFKTLKGDIMTKHLSVFALLVIGALSACSLDATPQQCKTTFLKLLESYGMTVNDLNNPIKVTEFKTKAKADGKWDQFTQLCNNPQYKDCKSCTCGLDMKLTGCMWNCSCCWGSTRCSSLP